MSPTDEAVGKSGRLGDVIRVVASLGEFGEQERELIARLLPAPALEDRGGRPAPADPRPAAMSAPPTDVNEPRYERLPDEPGAAAGFAAAARRGARWWLAAIQSLTLRVAGMRLRWLALGAAAVVAILVLLVAGAPFWLLELVILALTAIGAFSGALLRELWRSALLRSSASRDSSAAQGDRLGGAAGPQRSLPVARYTPPPRAEPIVGRGRGRALALSLAGVAVAGPLDIRRLVEEIARDRPGRTPPRLPRRSLRRGVQLIVERGPALDPLRDDIVLLGGWLQQVSSPAGLQRLGFRGDPWLVTGARMPGADPDEPLDYRAVLPRAGSAVVVVCDLGIARPRSGPAPVAAAVWRAHDRLLGQAGCRALYLVPYPRERWPAALVGRLAIVQWRDDLRLDELTAPATRVRTRGRP